AKDALLAHSTVLQAKDKEIQALREEEDMRVVLNQQVMQHEEERLKEESEKKEKSSGLQRSKSLKIRGEGSRGFFSTLFRDK
ncbi:hypothetical protein CRUP_037272, partial [Coryphaenoides rupestris]